MGYLLKLRLARGKIFKGQNKYLLSGNREGARCAKGCFSSGWCFGTVSFGRDTNNSIYGNKGRQAKNEGKMR